MNKRLDLEILELHGAKFVRIPNKLKRPQFNDWHLNPLCLNDIDIETDVKVNRKIDKEPLYDLSGPISGCGYMEELVMYDFWGNFIREQPFEEDKSSKWPHKFHTAMGATAFSRNFFNTCREKLPYVKLCYDTIPLNCYQDVLISCFARSFGCTLGDWSEASDTRGMPRYVNSEWIYTPVDMNCALVHNYKI